jgi:hypothetical protein
MKGREKLKVWLREGIEGRSLGKTAGNYLFNLVILIPIGVLLVSIFGDKKGLNLFVPAVFLLVGVEFVWIYWKPKK